MIKERRINHPSHIKAIMQEQINILRLNQNLEPMAKARTIAYLSNTALSAYKDGEMSEKIEQIMKQLDIK